MTTDAERRYAERLNRYVTTMRNGKADCVPIRPFVAEFTAKYAGYTLQEVTHDYQKAFAAVRKCAADFDWDAVVGNMVYVWTGLTQAIGLKYYAVPGIHVPPDTAFQYLEPSDENAFMRADEYDALIEDPTAFLFNVWLPRVSTDVEPLGEPTTYRNNLSFLKGGMAMLSYFNAFGEQNALLRSECGTVSAISGILKAPLDIIADKLRGFVGLSIDLLERPDKVLAACEALMPHLLHVALSGADPDKKVPITIWMHRGCVPFISQDQFDRFYWPTLKPIIEEIWSRGHQVLFYAEGDWNAHLRSFAELPDGSIIYHVDRADIFEVHRAVGDKFCISGGISNFLLAYGTPEEVRDACKKVIDGVARDGGYIMDASAIVQDDAKVENVRAMTEFTREYGVYSSGSATAPGDVGGGPAADGDASTTHRPVAPREGSGRTPGVCIPWEDIQRELPEISGDRELVRRVWEEIDALGYVYIWQCLLSF
ncbi:MAG: uroporphyrinogen decarboxylase family protein [Armatimonadota bacterium]